MCLRRYADHCLPFKRIEGTPFVRPSDLVYETILHGRDLSHLRRARGGGAAAARDIPLQLCGAAPAARAALRYAAARVRRWVRRVGHMRVPWRVAG